MRKLLAAIAAALFGVSVFGISPAAAHDQLLESIPAHNETVASSPSEITLLFNDEILDIADSSVIEVRDAAGSTISTQKAVILGDTVTLQLPEPLPADAVYRVVWRAVSQDGHPIEGSFNFGIGEVTAAELDTLPAAVNPGSNAITLDSETASAAESTDTVTGTDASTTTGSTTDNNQGSALSADETAANEGAPGAFGVVAASVGVVLAVALGIALFYWTKRRQIQ